ncbi:MAG: TlpA family protein disulfide reductase [Deltaproteobacteria bacterium]|nr:TlpA family protein disulfide reductase [Deltaproteobacteria bacterium]
MRRSLTMGAVFLLALPSLARAGEVSGAEDDLPSLGVEAPSFTLPVYNAELSGQPRAGTMLLVGDDAEDAGTKLILVSFMASYCKPCKKELPWLQQMHEQHQAQGLRVIAVAIDSEAEGQKEVAELLKQNKITFPVVKDQFNFVARRYLGNKVPLPSVFLIDRGGKITFVSRGYNQEIGQTLTSAVQKQLGVAPATKPKEAGK